jgi:hypothetical protein
MTSLKVEKRTIMRVDYKDLENFIFEKFGFKYSIPYSEDCINNTNLEFSVAKGKLEDWQRTAYERWLGVNSHETQSYLLGVILQVLCNGDLIEPGEYLVNVCW